MPKTSSLILFLVGITILIFPLELNPTLIITVLRLKFRCQNSPVQHDFWIAMTLSIIFLIITCEKSFSIVQLGLASTWVFGLGVYGILAKTQKYFQAGKMGFSFFENLRCCERF
jgi:hypothetical protein